MLAQFWQTTQADDLLHGRTNVTESVKEKAYLMTPEDGNAAGMRLYLHSLGAIVAVPPTERSKFPAHLEGMDAVILMVARGYTGRIPSRMLRRLASIEDAQRRGFFVPQSLLSFLDGRPARVVAILETACNENACHSLGRIAQLRLALYNEHYRAPDHAWTLPKKKRASRREDWKRRRSERRHAYAFA